MTTRVKEYKQNTAEQSKQIEKEGPKLYFDLDHFNRLYVFKDSGAPRDSVHYRQERIVNRTSQDSKRNYDLKPLLLKMQHSN